MHEKTDTARSETNQGGEQRSRGMGDTTGKGKDKDKAMNEQGVHVRSISVPPTEVKSVSEANRERLQAVCEKAGYTDVKFWIPPNVLPSEDECIAEVADALEKFHGAKSNGLKPDDA